VTALSRGSVSLCMCPFCAGAGVAAAQRLRARDYVPSAEHEEVATQLAAAKEQLVEALEELGARDRELAEARVQANRPEAGRRVQSWHGI
jgi:hypothetical protein